MAGQIAAVKAYNAVGPYRRPAEFVCALNAPVIALNQNNVIHKSSASSLSLRGCMKRLCIRKKRFS